MQHDRPRQPSKRRRRSPARLGVPTALVLAALVLLAAACNGDDPPDEPSAQDGQTRQEASAGLLPDLSTAHPTGAAVEQERFTVTVTSFGCEAQDEGLDRCVLTLDVTNATDTPQSVEFDRQLLLDEFATEYTHSPEATSAAGTSEEDIGAGESRTVALVFELPADVTIVAARLSDSPGDEGTLVDLLD